MTALASDPPLQRMARANAALLRRASKSHAGVEAVLNLGAVVGMHQAMDWALHELNRLLDQDVLRDLLVEYERLAQDLELLEILCEEEPETTDVTELAAVLMVRLRELLARQQRVFYEPLLRLASTSPGDD